jgi:hypothetical protein
MTALVCIKTLPISLLSSLERIFQKSIINNCSGTIDIIFNKNRLNRVMLPKKVLDTGKYKKNEQRAKTPKLGKADKSLIVSELCPRYNSKCKNKQKGNNSKIRQVCVSVLKHCSSIQ